MARKAWKDLSPAYKARLKRQGITAKSHRQADLNTARGHVSTKTPGAIKKSTIDRVLEGRGTVGEAVGPDLLDVFTWPTWVPFTVTDAQTGYESTVENTVAAALSLLPDPRVWESVTFAPQLEGPWEMTVKIKGRKNPKKILIPGGGADGTGAKQVLAITSGLTKEEDERRAKRRVELLFTEFDRSYGQPRA